MVSAMMLAAPGSSVTGMKGREEAEEADGVTAAGVPASSEEIIWFQNRGGELSNVLTSSKASPKSPLAA